MPISGQQNPKFIKTNKQKCMSEYLNKNLIIIKQKSTSLTVTSHSCTQTGIVVIVKHHKYYFFISADSVITHALYYNHTNKELAMLMPFCGSSCIAGSIKAHVIWIVSCTKNNPRLEYHYIIYILRKELYHNVFKFYKFYMNCTCSICFTKYKTTNILQHYNI